MEKKWVLAPMIDDSFRQQFPEMDPVVLQLLWNRNLRTQKDIDIFLGPDWGRDTFSCGLFRQMPAAVARVFTALQNNEVITVHGDYDADGVCGSAILVSTLRDLARAVGVDPLKITAYIPHREKEGYGLSVATAEHLKSHEKTALIITVDCGISNKEAIARAKELGIDTIICDHHTIPKELPTTAIIIHPLIEGEIYPNKSLCGTGVAFKLACALFTEARRRGLPFSEGYEKWLIDLVAIATVTDVMSVIGENRVLLQYGLLVMNKTKRVGLQKLIEISGAKSGELDTFSIAFQIGPRINAAGRMNHANQALHLLLEEDPARAVELAAALQEINVSRQKASELMYYEAKEQIGEVAGRGLLVAHDEGWPAGLVGLVAGKLVTDFHRPVLIIGQDGDHYVGSGRSIEGFNIMGVLQAAAPYLDRFGGHPQACGFSIVGQENFINAVMAMSAYVQNELSSELLVSRVKVDTEITLEEVNWKLHHALEEFAPFGADNPRPLFLSSGLVVKGMDTVGVDGKHLRLTVASPRGTIWKMIGFKLGEWRERIRLGDFVDVVYEIGENEWRGNLQLQLKIIDLRKSKV